MRARTIMVIHREKIVAEAIAAALDRFPSAIVVAVGTDGGSIEGLETRIDAAAVDAKLPNVASLASTLRRRGTRVVLIGDGDEDENGVSVSADASVQALLSALVPEAVPPRRNHLTHREQQILALVARGLAGKQVAKQLGISPKTVEQHKTRIFSKLGVPNQTAAVTMAMTGGFTMNVPSAWNVPTGVAWSPSRI